MHPQGEDPLGRLDHRAIDEAAIWKHGHALTSRIRRRKRLQQRVCCADLIFARTESAIDDRKLTRVDRRSPKETLSPATAAGRGEPLQVVDVRIDGHGGR